MRFIFYSYIFRLNACNIQLLHYKYLREHFIVSRSNDIIAYVLIGFKRLKSLCAMS